jgi:hypothetical protein
MNEDAENYQTTERRREERKGEREMGRCKVRISSRLGWAGLGSRYFGTRYLLLTDQVLAQQVPARRSEHPAILGDTWLEGVSSRTRNANYLAGDELERRALQHGFGHAEDLIQCKRSYRWSLQ